MILSSAGKNGTNREFRKLIRRERFVWLSGIVVPILMLLAIFVL
ncbi:hypothetical protein [Pararhizobium antarcticum]|nr:hypothetical protein [Pararhizobium antarcticum]